MNIHMIANGTVSYAVCLISTVLCVSSVSVSTARRTFCCMDFVNRHRTLVIKLSSTNVGHLVICITHCTYGKCEMNFFFKLVI